MIKKIFILKSLLIDYLKVDHCKSQNTQNHLKSIMKLLESHHLGSFVQQEAQVYTLEFQRILIGLKVLCGSKISSSCHHIIIFNELTMIKSRNVPRRVWTPSCRSESTAQNLLEGVQTLLVTPMFKTIQFHPINSFFTLL